MLRKSLATAAAFGALVLPLVLAAPASATPAPAPTCAQLGAVNIHVGDPRYRPALDRDHDGIACESGTTGGSTAQAGAPGGCSDENAGAAGQTHPRCGSDILHAGARVNLNTGGTCGDDTLLLISVRANEGGTHKTLVDARNADRDAQNELATAKSNDLKAEQDVVTAQARVNKDANAEALDAASDASGNGTVDQTDAEDVAVDAANNDKSAADQALINANSLETQRDNELEAAQHKADGTHAALVKAERADAALVARIDVLVGRINTECTTPAPTTTPVPPPTTDVPPPPATTIVPPPAQTVIVPGPTTVIEPGPSQIGQAPQGFVSAGGGADAAIVSAQS